ncbi:MAG: ATP-dependent RecD-like DNA helicase, partial [Acutalibacteraceae bacterium]|nr:ATP-dependent RecD-like DNA helicase [Acutalibacteraceae bacterium]
QNTLSGTVDNITYRNDENGYCVFELETESELVTVVGYIPQLCAGETITVKGEFTVHPSYGDQFRADSFERKAPATESAILRYLSSGAIKGIGPVTANAIVEQFGDRTLEIIENQPMRLATIKGISKAKAEKIGEEYKKQFGVREVLIQLSELNITPSEALRIYNKMGAASVEKIKQNPYMLCSESIGFNFVRADEISQSLESSVPADYRMAAGVEYILRHNLRNGHTCIPRDKLAATGAKMLGYDIDRIDNIIEQMIGGGKLNICDVDDKPLVFLPYMYDAERYCANRIALMLKIPPKEIAVHKSRLEGFEAQNGILYDDSQRKAIAEALSSGIMVLTGGPGTGKTTTLNAIITLLEEAGCVISLAAPTGRAAKRMTELTNREAKTIHRLLEVEWGEGDKPIFKRDEKNPLDCDVIIVDELSMMDVQLFASLLKSMTMNCRLIMVGDVDQLPSVGAGNVLGDLIDSGLVPTVRLERVFRQSKESMIITNAHKIIKGEMPIVSKDGDFFTIDAKSGQAAAELICDLYCNRLQKAYGYSPLDDIQVLCPSRKRNSGTVALNAMLQQQINPPAKHKREYSHKGVIMREGDKVMQRTNNYDVIWTKDNGSEGTGVFNGDIGVLTKVDAALGTVSVRFDDRTAIFTGEQLDDIELAYAITVHKSQGSEFDCVILPVVDIPPMLCYRNLFYTAVTRAKKMLIVIGSGYDIKRMIDNNVKTKRYTAFGQFLKSAADLKGVLGDE